MPLRHLLLAVACAAAFVPAAPVLAQGLHEEARKGRDLTAAEAQALEEELAANPRNLGVRARLLGYYFGGMRNPVRQAEHALWFIENAPEAEVLEGPWGSITSFRNPEAYLAGKERWLRWIEDEPENTVFLRHATSFLGLTDRELAATLLARAEGLDPENPEWARSLGQHHWREARSPFGEPDTASAARAVAAFERAYALADAEGKGALLQYLGMAAFIAGDLEKARIHAAAMLDEPPDDWNRGNRIHYGNLILGRIAFDEGDLPEAGARLLAAGRTPGSPQLNSFGPDMALAEKLLEAGERGTVLRYLELCQDFWNSDRDQLEDWIVLVEAGRTPDFRRNRRF